MTNETETEQRLIDDSDVAVPRSAVPSMDSLHQKVGSLRRRRKITRVATSVAAVAVVIGSLTMFNRDGAQVNPPNNQVAVAADVPGAVQSTSGTPTPEIRKPKIQLYARVRGSVPVFDIDAEKKVIQHVGWAESEQRVPVDMRYVPENQQETFNAVLSSDDDWHLSL